MRSQAGHTMAFMVLALLVVSALVVTASRTRLTEAEAARSDWLAAAADGLAEAGVQAGLAAARRGWLPQAAPLGERISLGTGVVGRLRVEAKRAGREHHLRSCAEVERTGHRRRSCIEATVTRGRWAEITAWRATP